jgi:2-oxoglutarate ferredoxin oxidoreductase subunit beta
VELHDGSSVVLKKLDMDHDPTSRLEAMRVLYEAQENNWLITGLIYLDNSKPSLTDLYNLVDTPLNRLQQADLRPSRESLAGVNDMMF